MIPLITSGISAENHMKQLFPKQAEALKFFETCHDLNINTLDTSHVGTGKTVVAAHLASSLCRPVAVICPKAVIPSWERELEENGIDPIFVLNYEKLRTGRTPHVKKRGKKIFAWQLPPDTLMLFDECHKAKGPYTQNAQLLIAAAQAGYPIHMMSATAAEDPTEMRAIGFALGLHSLNAAKGDLKSWYSWMRCNGCYQNQWKAWELRKRSALKDLHDTMYQKSVKRLTVSDFPDSFKNNRIFVEPIQFSNLSKINKAYAELGITPEIVTQFIEEGTVEDSEFVLVNMLRARQLAESFKVHDLVEMANDLRDEGNSVVLFVNFRETADALAEALKCGKIEGGQDAALRQQYIDEFQEDDADVLIVNIAAGGTGISLHDVRGERPRVSLISPSFNVKDHLQALGRIHRNGAKSDALQKVLVASGTVEEAVLKAIDRKSSNLDMLHG